MDTTTSAESFERLAKTGYRTAVGEWISGGWALLMPNLWSTIAYSLLVFAALFLVGFVIGFFTVFSTGKTVSETYSAAVGAILGVFTVPAYLGYLVVALKTSRGQAVSFNDYLSVYATGFGRAILLTLAIYVVMLAAALVIAVFMLSNPFLAMIPYLALIYLGISFSLALPLIVDQKMGIWQTLEVSRRVVTKGWWAFFGWGLLLALIQILGALALFVGLLVTAPLIYFSLAAAYESIRGQAQQLLQRPPASL